MKVISVRLPDETYEQLRERGERLGFAPAVLARAYIKGALDYDVDLMVTPSLPEESKLTTTPTSSGRKKKKPKRGR
jgi:predicted DNA-binding protein